MNPKIKRKGLYIISSIMMFTTLGFNVINAEEVKCQEFNIDKSVEEKIIECRVAKTDEKYIVKGTTKDGEVIKRVLTYANKDTSVSAKGDLVLIDIPSIEESKKEIEELKEKAKKAKALEAKKEKEKLSLEKISKLVLNGSYGNGAERKARLEKEGYDFNAVQKEVKKIEPKVAPKAKQTKAAPAARAKATGNVIPAYPHRVFKSYMRWTALSSSSPQGRLAAQAVKDPSTAIMMKDGRYLVALGNAYANYIGEHIDIVMESGQVIPAIVGDWKAVAHTDQWNSASLNNGSVIEFIVSSNGEANAAVNGAGSYNSLFPGMVKEFRK